MPRTDHPSFPQPKIKNTKIWRYLDTPKFLALLQSQRLYFARADKLGDPFEGSVTASMGPHLRSALQGNPSKRAIESIFGAKSKEDAIRALDEWSDMRRMLTTKMFVSCWHASDHESAAMWRLYGASDDSVAIQTTYRLLCKSLPDEVSIGEVRYLDYEKDTLPDANAYTAFTCKRKSFEHEREVRAIIWEMSATLAKPISADGRIEIRGDAATVKVDLQQLVRRVYVSPTSKPWYVEVIRDAMQRYGLDAPIDHSSLAGSPIY